MRKPGSPWRCVLLRAQNNFDIGYKAVETMVKILNGEQYDKVVDTGTEIITKDTAEASLAKFDEWMK